MQQHSDVERGSGGPGPRVHAALAGFENGSNVVFFGNTVSTECQRCDAYSSTNRGHKYCVHVTCPLALKEFKRRKRKRTSSLEKVYLPKMKVGGGATGEGLRD